MDWPEEAGESRVTIPHRNRHQSQREALWRDFSSEESICLRENCGPLNRHDVFPNALTKQGDYWHGASERWRGPIVGSLSNAIH